ncbi:UNVERIFIED_CONTAM: hypothetical protein FKN15_070268 [Acipenser sinensis]
MAPHKGKEKKEEQVISLGPQVAEGENVFGTCHIFTSFNDTFVRVTDLSGKETICCVTGGMKVKADRDESCPYAAMLAAQDVSEVQGAGYHCPAHETARNTELEATELRTPDTLHMKLHGTGGNRTPDLVHSLHSEPWLVLGCGILSSSVSNFRIPYSLKTMKLMTLSDREDPVTGSAALLLW